MDKMLPVRKLQRVLGLPIGPKGFDLLPCVLIKVSLRAQDLAVWTQEVIHIPCLHWWRRPTNLFALGIDHCRHTAVM